MTILASIFLLFFAPEITLGFPVTASENTTLLVFFCKNPGCASSVTKVFCNDNLLFRNTSIPECTDLPPPNTVCQHDGRAFVSIITHGSCDFEGHTYINTEKCTEHTDVCTFTRGTTPSLPTTTIKQKDQINIIGVIGSVLVLLLVALVLVIRRICKRRQNQHPRSCESEPLEMQRPREARLENGRLPSCDTED